MKSYAPLRLGLVWVVMFMLLTLVSAEQTVKTLEIPIGYVASASANTDYVVPINIVSPDGIAQIISVELIVKGDFLSSSVLQGRVKGENDVLYSCNPISWTTPSVSTYGYEASFDCSDLVKQYDFKGGEISFGLRSSRNAKNLRGMLKITYYNKPETIAQVFGTEYLPSENGTVFLQLFDSNENTVDDAYCEINIYYPDKTLWYDSIYMDFLESGLYYKDIMIPDNELGVFMTSAFCSYEENLYEYKLPSEDVLYGGSLMTLNYLSTDDAENVEDMDCVFVATDGGTYQEFRYDYTTIGNLNLTAIDEISLVWVGSNEKNGAYLQAWNFDTSSWDTIGATFSKTDVTPFQCERSHAVSRSITSSLPDYVEQDEVRFRMIMGSDGEIYTDEATVIFHGTGEYIDSIRGGGELHVSSLVNQTFNCSIGDVSADVNVSEISEDVWSFHNRSLTENITASVNIDLCDVWDCSDRELTDFDFDIDCGDVNASVEVTGGFTDICPNTCTTEQEQYSYPNCQCYCEDSCTDGKVQDEHCDCYVPLLSEIRIMESVGVHDVLSYEAMIQDADTNSSLSGVECDIVIYRGDEVFKIEKDIVSQKSGMLLGQYRVNDEFMVDSTYNFTIQCGEDTIYKEFLVTTEVRPRFGLNAILFIKENVEAIVVLFIVGIIAVIGIWKYINGY